MKKIYSLLLVVVMLLSLCACGKNASKITWDSTSEECVEQMKKVYKISDEDIDVDDTCCEFNFFDDIKFENFDNAELEFYFDDNGNLGEIIVYDSGAYIGDMSKVSELATSYLGESSINTITLSQSKTADIHYWQKGDTGAYIIANIQGGPYVAFVNLNNEDMKEKFEKLTTRN